jgi:hypothetical protein
LPAPASCNTVNGSAATCQLTLTYQPPAAASGTLQVDYSYTNNAGQPGSGTLAIPYSAN